MVEEVGIKINGDKGSKSEQRSKELGDSYHLLKSWWIEFPVAICNGIVKDLRYGSWNGHYRYENTSHM